MAEDMVRLALEIGVAERIHFVQPVAAELLVSLISDADLAVVPIENVCLSYYYSLPNKVFEAAMAGLPILVSDFPELRQFVRQHRVGKTVDFNDLRTVRAEIAGMLANKFSYNDAAKAKLIRDKLSFDKGLRRVTEELTNSQPGG